jgi:hypothetical protein
VCARARAFALGALALVASHCRLPEVVRPPAPAAPSADWGLELTDAAHRVGSDLWIDTNAVRIGDSVYFVFLTSEDRANAEPGRVFVRRLDLRTNALGPFVRVFDQFQPGGNNHMQPSLARDATALWVLFPWSDGKQTVANLGCADDPRRPAPRQSCGLALARRIPDLADPGSWSPPGGLPMRMRNTFGISHLRAAPASAGLQMFDWTSVYDPDARTGYAIAQMLGIAREERPGAEGRFDGRPVLGGFPVGLARLLPGGRVDAPYMITDTESRYPGGAAGRCNIMAKAVLRVGRPLGTRRRLHLLWVNRCQLIGKPLLSCWDPAYAFSDDGGASWTNFARNATRRLPERIAWNDPAFRIFEGDVAPSTEGGFWAGDDDVLHYLHRVPDPRSGAPTWHDPRAGRVHVAAKEGIALDLVYRRCTPGAGCRQIGGVIERGASGRDQLAVASDGTLFAFMEWPLRYRTSRDGGRTWSDPTLLGPRVPTWRLHMNPDSEERDVLHLVMQGTARGEEDRRRVFYVRFDLRAR